MRLLERFGKKLFSKKHFSKKQIYMALVFAAGAALIVAVLHGTGDVHDETAPSMVVTPSEVPVSESSEEETTQAEQVKKEEVKKKYVPAINAMNLAYYFPKGADDTEDRLNSYAGEVYKKLMKKDNTIFMMM